MHDHPHPTTASPDDAELQSLRDELDAARAELSALRETSLREWVSVMDSESRVLGQVYNTFSWRVTWPLRAARRYQIAVRDHGLGAANRAAGSVVVRLLRRSR